MKFKTVFFRDRMFSVTASSMEKSCKNLDFHLNYTIFAEKKKQMKYVIYRNMQPNF